MKNLQNFNLELIPGRNKKVLLIDVVMHDDLMQILFALGASSNVNVYVSKEWALKIGGNFRIGRIYSYEYRGMLTSIFNFAFIFDNIRSKYDVVIVNCDENAEFLKYVIFNLIFLRKRKVYLLTTGLRELKSIDVLKFSVRMLCWAFIITLEFIISLVCLAYLRLIYSQYRLLQKWYKLAQ